MEAQEWCRKYQRSGNVKDLTQAWDLYYLVFRRISKQLPQVRRKLCSQEGNHCFIQIHVNLNPVQCVYLWFQLTSLELQYVSPKLLMCRDLELAVPGTYEPHKPVIHIRHVHASLNVITSKQRPRKLCITGECDPENSLSLVSMSALKFLCTVSPRCSCHPNLLWSLILIVYWVITF